MNTLPSPAAAGSVHGSLLAGTGLGLAMLLGGYFLLWLMTYSLQQPLALVLYLVLPWLGLGALAVFLRREGRVRTAWGLGLAGLIVIGIAVLLAGLVLLLLGNSGWH